MGKNKVFLLFIALSGMFIQPCFSQYDGMTFTDSVYVASRTHYFIPQKIIAGDTTYITQPSAFSQIEWRENGNLISPDSSMQEGHLIYTHQFSGPGSYEITMEAVDATGLSYFASKNISVTDQLEIPNVFSPDEDGINDVFIVKSSGDNKLKLEIYTRNGDLIHEKIGKLVYWDGKLASGNYANPGVYYYVVKSQGGEDIVRKGFFHLFR